MTALRMNLYLAAIGLGGWGLSVAFWSGISPPDAFWGMVAPVVIGMLSMAGIQRRYNRAPETLTNFMIAAFAVKMIFYGVWVTIMILYIVQFPTIFIINFVIFFILCHLLEALYLRATFIPRKE